VLSLTGTQSQINHCQLYALTLLSEPLWNSASTINTTLLLSHVTVSPNEIPIDKFIASVRNYVTDDSDTGKQGKDMCVLKAMDRNYTEEEYYSNLMAETINSRAIIVFNNVYFMFVTMHDLINNTIPKVLSYTM